MYDTRDPLHSVTSPSIILCNPMALFVPEEQWNVRMIPLELYLILRYFELIHNITGCIWIRFQSVVMDWNKATYMKYVIVFASCKLPVAYLNVIVFDE